MIPPGFAAGNSRPTRAAPDKVGFEERLLWPAPATDLVSVDNRAPHSLHAPNRSVTLAVMVRAPKLKTAKSPTPFEAGPFRLRMGLSSLDLANWIDVDENLASELAEKRRLLADQHRDVFAALPAGSAGASEVLNLLVSHLPKAYPQIYRRSGSLFVNRVTEETWNLERSGLHPLEIAGRLVQEDLCLLSPGSDTIDYVLSAACLCFPTRWRLSEKIGRSLDAMHVPVPGYGDQLSESVNGLFRRLRPDRPVARSNWSVLDDPALYQPGGHGRTAYSSAVTPDNAGEKLWLRVERQTLRRLPETGEVLFTIRVFVRPFSQLANRPGDAARLASALEGMADDMRVYKSLPPFIEAALAWLRRIAPDILD